jgi:hypothetical protein
VSASKSKGFRQDEPLWVLGCIGIPQKVNWALQPLSVELD